MRAGKKIQQQESSLDAFICIARELRLSAAGVGRPATGLGAASLGLIADHHWLRRGQRAFILACGTYINTLHASTVRMLKFYVILRRYPRLLIVGALASVVAGLYNTVLVVSINDLILGDGAQRCSFCHRFVLPTGHECV